MARLVKLAVPKPQQIHLQRLLGSCGSERGEMVELLEGVLVGHGLPGLRYIDTIDLSRRLDSINRCQGVGKLMAGSSQPEAPDNHRQMQLQMSCNKIETRPSLRDGRPIT
jgi:hypothetical protein